MINLAFVLPLNALRATRHVSADELAKLRQYAQANDTPRFTAELQRLAASAPAHTAETELDAFEVNKSNPFLLKAMKACGVTKAQLAEYGPKVAMEDRVLPNLRELADNTDTRGDRMGVGK